MKLTKHYILLFLSLLIASVNAFGQTLPVDAFVQLNPPYSVNYTDYYEPGSDLLQANLIFQDFNEPSHDVRLQLVIESSDVRISTKSTFVPANAIILTPGVPETIEGSAWEEYFDLNNVDLSGITQSQLATNGTLPEGFYQFTVTVLDYTTGKVLSQSSSATAFLSQGSEPLITWPQCGEVVAAEDPQNVLFQWQDRNIISASDDQIAYKLYLYEITDNNVDPLYAYDNGKTLLIYESDELTTTTFQYDLAATILEEGKKYFFRVQVFDPFGKWTFKNNGFSQNCWFYYGYPSDGTIALSAPETEFKFSHEEPRLFSWSAPDKLMDGQFFNYKLKIIEYDEDADLEDQMVDNIAWHEENSISTSSLNDWQMEVAKEFDEQKLYAWQVTAYTDGQQIAESEIRVFYGPSLLDYFMAGQHKVIVTNLSNNDLTSLAGQGTITMVTPDNDTIQMEVDYEDLHVIDVAGRYVLDDGEILVDLVDYEYELQPSLPENDVATFYGAQLKLDKEALQISGEFQWPLPHPTDSKALAHIKSGINWLNFDSYSLFGVTNLGPDNDFELMDPLGFKLDFFQSSEIQIDQNIYELRLDGDIYLPASVHDFDNNRISFTFRRAEQLYYFGESDVTLSNAIALVDNTQLSFDVASAIIDLDENQSPLKMSDDKEFKGVYFDQFGVNYPIAIDDKNQLVFDHDTRTDFELDLSNDFKAWVSSDGLVAYFHDTFEAGSVGTFNAFPAVFTSFDVDIEHNAVTDSDFKGTIKIPVFDAHKDFGFTIPMSNGGFEPGYLDENLESSTFVFSPYGGENRVDFTIKKATFADNERLDLTVDIEIPYIEVNMEGVSDLKVFGDYYIGFGERNGATVLTEQVEGTYDGFTMYLDKIGCGLQNGEYQFSYSATMPLGDEMSGEEGAPRIDIFSSAPAGDDVAIASSGGDAPAMAMEKPYFENDDPQTITVDSMFVEVKSDLIDCLGYLILTKNDPTWGTSMQGGLRGDLKMPTQISLGTNMILGTKDKMKYWYMDAWFVDYQGTGISVFNMFNVVAFEGKIYRHMRMDMTSEESTQPQVVIDPDVEFGAGLYMQLTDAQGGKQFTSDVGIELVVEESHFTVAMSGDISIMNSEGRSTASLTTLAKDIAAEQAQEAAMKAIAENIDIDLEVSLSGGKKLGVKADANYGQFKYESGGSGILIDGDVSATPIAGVTLYEGDKSLAIKGSVDGQGSIAIENGDDRLGLSYYETDGAKVDFAYGGTELGASYNKDQGYGAFKLSYDESLIDVAVNQSEKSGHVELALDDSKRIYAAANGEEGSGEFELEYDDVLVQLEANKTEKSGKLNVQVGDDFISGGLNQTEGTGELAFQFDQVSYQMSGDKTGKVDLSCQVGEDEVVVLVDKEAGLGEIGVGIDGNNVAVKLDKAGAGTLEIETGNLTLGVTAEKEAGAGSFLYDDGNIKLDVGANKSEKTGYSKVFVGEDSVVAEITTTDRRLDVAIDGYYVGVKNTGTETGEITVQKDDKTIAFGGNVQEKSGFMKLENGDDVLSISANKSNNTGEFSLDLDEIVVIAGRDEEKNYFTYKNADLDLSGEGNSNYGSFRFAKGSNEFSLGLNKEEKSGELGIATPNFGLNTTLGLESQTGSIEVEAGGNIVSLAVEEDNKSVGFERGQTKVKATAFNSGDKRLLVNQDGYAVQYDYASSVHNLSVTKDDLTIAANTSKEISITYQSDVYLASFKNNSVDLTKNGVDLETALENSGNGAINFADYTNGQLQLTLTATDGTYEFAYDNNLKLGYVYGGDKYIEVTADETYRATLSEAKQLTLTRGSEQRLFIDPAGELALENGSDQKFRVTTEQVEATYGEYVVGLTKTSVDFTNGDHTFHISPEKAEWSQGTKHVYLTNEQVFHLATSENKYVTLSPEGGELQYDASNIIIGNNKGLTYSDDVRSFALDEQGLRMQQEDNMIAFNADKSMEMALGTERTLKVSQESLEMSYYGRNVAFGADKSLSYSDDDRSIDLATTGLSYEEGDKKLEVLDANGERSLLVAKGDRSFTYKDGQATVVDGDNSLAIGGDAYFDLNYEGKQIYVAKQELRYQEGERVLAFGGDENFVEAREGERGIKFTQEKTLVVEDGDKYLSVSAEKVIEASDGDKTITIGGENLVKYEDGDNAVKLYQLGSSQYGFGVERGDYSIALEGGKDMDATLRATAQDATIAVSSDSKANVTTTFGYAGAEYELKTGKQGLSFSGLEDEDEEVTTENLEGAAEVDYSGPQYIGMVTDGADGRAKGHIEMYFNSKEMHFIANASLTSVAPPCVQAAMAAEASPDYWKIDIGTEEERIEIYPSCSGFGGGGWLNLDPSTINVGVFAGFTAGGSVNIGVAKVGADVWAELGVRAKAQLEPKFYILEAGVWVEVGAEVWVDPITGGRFTVAGIYLRGELMVYFLEKTQVEGTLEGKVTICGISEDFKLGFNKEF